MKKLGPGRGRRGEATTARMHKDGIKRKSNLRAGRKLLSAKEGGTCGINGRFLPLGLTFSIFIARERERERDKHGEIPFGKRRQKERQSAFLLRHSPSRAQKFFNDTISFGYTV